jgi:hypothetical protein
VPPQLPTSNFVDQLELSDLSKGLLSKPDPELKMSEGDTKTASPKIPKLKILTESNLKAPASPEIRFEDSIAIGDIKKMGTSKAEPAPSIAESDMMPTLVNEPDALDRRAAAMKKMKRRNDSREKKSRLSGLNSEVSLDKTIPEANRLSHVQAAVDKEKQREARDKQRKDRKIDKVSAMLAKRARQGTMQTQSIGHFSDMTMSMVSQAESTNTINFENTKKSPKRQGQMQRHNSVLIETPCKVVLGSMREIPMTPNKEEPIVTLRKSGDSISGGDFSNQRGVKKVVTDDFDLNIGKGPIDTHSSSNKDIIGNKIDVMMKNQESKLGPTPMVTVGKPSDGVDTGSVISEGKSGISGSRSGTGSKSSGRRKRSGLDSRLKGLNRARERLQKTLNESANVNVGDSPNKGSSEVEPKQVNTDFKVLGGVSGDTSGFEITGNTSKATPNLTAKKDSGFDKYGFMEDPSTQKKDGGATGFYSPSKGDKADDSDLTDILGI